MKGGARHTLPLVGFRIINTPEEVDPGDCERGYLQRNEVSQFTQVGEAR